MRGKRANRKPKRAPNRLIPAGAGKTVFGVGSRYGMSAHPRRCGENYVHVSYVDVVCGSSPQVRGKRPVAAGGIKVCRLIPAGAGKTIWASSMTITSTAHPRRCGENFAYSCQVPGAVGSSPQVRGKLVYISTAPFCCRLIPAGAGKTCFRQAEAPSHSAHPRRCGENRANGSRHTLLTGSSPQVRGKRKN